MSTVLFQCVYCFIRYFEKDYNLLSKYRNSTLKQRFRAERIRSYSSNSGPKALTITLQLRCLNNPINLDLLTKLVIGIVDMHDHINSMLAMHEYVISNLAMNDHDNSILVVHDQTWNLLGTVQLQFVEHSNRRKMQGYSMRRKNSISPYFHLVIFCGE